MLNRIAFPAMLLCAAHLGACKKDNNDSSHKPRTGELVYYANPSGSAWQLHMTNGDGRHVRTLSDLTLSLTFKLVVSHDGTRVLVHTNSNGRYALHVVDKATGTTKKLADDAVQGAWSPDDKLVAFTKVTGNVTHQIGVVNSDGSNERLVVTGSRSTCPAWAADGSKILFAHNDQLHSVNKDGSGMVALRGGEERLYTGPVVSPDGKQVAFFALLPQNRVELFVANVDGSNRKSIAAGHYNPNITYEYNPAKVFYLQWHQWPVWSPDGAQIAYSTLRQGHTDDLFAVNADGTNDRQLVASEDNDVEPSWSADGKYVYYTDRWHLLMPGVPDKIRVVKATGGISVQLTNNDVAEYGPMVIR